jgi:RNA polymerase sigma-70 factor (ECF subfamily)
MRRDAFERLYADHAEPLLGFLIYRTGDRALAEDLLADAFERAIRARSRFDRRRGREKTWLYTIAMNCLRDHRRREGAEERALERAAAGGAAASDDPAEAVADRDAVGRAMQALTEEERDAIALRYGADMSLPEIAELAGLPLTTVRGRVYGAMEKMRDQLG